MKHNLLILKISILAILFSVQNVMAKQKKPKYYKIKTELMDGKFLKGYLYKVNNQSVYILTDRTSTQIDSIKGEEIKRVAIRRKGKVGRAIGIGAITGGLSIGIIEAARYTPCTGWCLFAPRSAADQGIQGFGVGALGGIIVGGIAGIFNNSAERINGNMATYLRYVPKMKKYALQP
jgi:hypothetical protein